LRGVVTRRLAIALLPLLRRELRELRIRGRCGAELFLLRLARGADLAEAEDQRRPLDLPFPELVRAILGAEEPRHGGDGNASPTGRDRSRRVITPGCAARVRPPPPRPAATRSARTPAAGSRTK